MMHKLVVMLVMEPGQSAKTRIGLISFQRRKMAFFGTISTFASRNTISENDSETIRAFRGRSRGNSNWYCGPLEKTFRVAMRDDFVSARNDVRGTQSKSE
jgi:hypothetical protein